MFFFLVMAIAAHFPSELIALFTHKPFDVVINKALSGHTINIKNLPLATFGCSGTSINDLQSAFLRHSFLSTPPATSIAFQWLLKWNRIVGWKDKMLSQMQFMKLLILDYKFWGILTIIYCKVILRDVKIYLKISSVKSEI